MRYFMIDRVTDLETGHSASAIKNVSLSENVLHDHFPDFPVFPGALVVEAMAQLGGFLIEMSYNTPASIRRALLAQIDRAKFHRPAEPGDQIRLKARLTDQMEDAAKVSVGADLGGEKMATATLTFILKEIDSQRIHEQRRYCYRLWTKHLDRVPEIL